MKTTPPLEGYWDHYVQQVKNQLSDNFHLTPLHYSEMMQAYIHKQPVTDVLVKKLKALKQPTATKKSKSTKHKQKDSRQ